MIKLILQTVPSYVMNIYLLPHLLCLEIEKMINSFWWSFNSRQNRPINWLRWDKLVIMKDFGGLGFRNLNAFNLMLMGKQAWNLMTNSSSLIS
uniref:Uncharacterized protein n=1 Tax=Cajanus cajan TaxID=3821 RepID=A0A151TST3_CAJCA|nr:hypothetical protein KK1_009333 [Cajanus cajan]